MPRLRADARSLPRVSPSQQDAPLRRGRGLGDRPVMVTWVRRCGIACQCDKWKVALPGRRPRAIGGNPDCTIGFAAVDKPRTLRSAKDRARDRRAQIRCATDSQSSSQRPAAPRRHCQHGASGRPEKRVPAFRSFDQPAQHLDGERSRAGQPTILRRRNELSSDSATSASIVASAIGALPTGRPAQRAPQ